MSADTLNQMIFVEITTLALLSKLTCLWGRVWTDFLLTRTLVDVGSRSRVLCMYTNSVIDD